MTEKNSLNLSRDEKTPHDFVQWDTGASVRYCRRRLGVLGIRVGEGSGRMMLGFHRRQPGSSELLRLQVRFRASDGGLSSVEIRRCAGRRTCPPGSRNGLPGVAQFLHGSSGASEQAGDTDKYGNEAQHRGLGH